MISADDGPIKSEETRVTGQRRTPPHETLYLLSAVVVWLATGTTMSSLNKWIFTVYNFRYPLLLSALHMLTAIVLGILKYWFFRNHVVDKQDLSSSAKYKVFLLSLSFCTSIAFGNIGLNYVQLSFAQMIYTTTPIFTLAISSLVLGKQHHILKYMAMMPICLGASFSIIGEVQFDQTGCLFVLAATVLRGVKSIQQNILIQEEKINSVYLLYLMAIPSFCILAVAALLLEDWAALQSPHHYDSHLWGFIILSCLGSVLYNLASFCVIRLTSAVTLHILGNLSVVGNLLLSQMLFSNQFSALSCAGAVLTLSGMIVYQNSEYIIAYMDAHHAGSSNVQNYIDEVESYSGCTYETSSYLAPSQEPSVGLYSEVCHSTESSLELDDDSEPWEELHDDLEPHPVLEPSQELGDDLQISPKVNHVQETHPAHDHDLEPPPKLDHYLQTSPKVNHVPEPGPAYDHDLEPASKLCHALQTSPKVNHVQEPRQAHGHDLEPASKASHDPQISTKVCHVHEPHLAQDYDLEPPPKLHHDLQISPKVNHVQEPHLSHNYDLELFPELDHDLQTSLKVSHVQELHPAHDHILEPSPKLDHDLQICPKESHVQEPHPTHHYELEPSPKLDHDLQTSPKVNHVQEPHLSHYYDLEASPELDHDLQTSPKVSHVQELHPAHDHNLEPSPKRDHDLQKSLKGSHVQEHFALVPHLAHDYDLEPSPEPCSDLQPPPELLLVQEPHAPNHNLEPSQELYPDLEPSSEPYLTLDVHDLGCLSDSKSPQVSSLEEYSDSEPSADLELFPELSLKSDRWTEPRFHEKMD